VHNGRLTEGRTFVTGTVLIVDDQELVRAVVSRFLARNGYSVASAGTGQQALDALAWHHPSVVIADAEMATDDGALVKRLRAEDSAVPLVLMSDSGHLTTMESAACLVKPFDVGLLLDTVVDLVGCPEYAIGD
jgi:two-component system, cell cycle sensor histidine kinase and response regulator CckA